ncbi:hypothetical protein SAMN05216588_101257 [Pseudomonas flavescens]|uniref:Uncharacterized protein n=1 Tax=Phytopseudomonas flavescens TaxID=29435 RepID=A0A1G7XSM7_9GAMM|nr:hypothetical protein [Pseudomonas flavescens]SDG87177.1 hypothetical protein SAMN05216588_101257 [Pseudomonas flavescens]
MIVDDVMTDKITLHGLGFVQVQLPADQRLHVWHPELPRRHCFEHSAIHDHRFNFASRVLVGEQVNIRYAIDLAEAGEYMLYLHEGARTSCGGRPWVPDGRAHLTEIDREAISAGETYFCQAYRYHRTEPGGDGRVATVMTKRGEGQSGAHSSCLIGIEPDVNFDRYQWSPAQLWEIVSEVLTGSKQP